MATGVYDRASDFVRSAFDRRIATPAVLGAATYFPAHGDFCASWEKIRAEGLTVAEGYNRIPRFHEVMAEQAPISDNDGRDWRLFILKAYGIEIPGNMQSARSLPRWSAAIATYSRPRSLFLVRESTSQDTAVLFEGCYVSPWGYLYHDRPTARLPCA